MEAALGCREGQQRQPLLLPCHSSNPAGGASLFVAAAASRAACSSLQMPNPNMATASAPLPEPAGNRAQTHP